MRTKGKYYTEGEVRLMFLKAVRKVGNNRQFAKAHGLSAAYVGEVINGKKPPAGAVLDFLGLEIANQVTTYRQKIVRMGRPFNS